MSVLARAFEAAEKVMNVKQRAMWTHTPGQIAFLDGKVMMTERETGALSVVATITGCREVYHHAASMLRYVIEECLATNHQVSFNLWGAAYQCFVPLSDDYVVEPVSFESEVLNHRNQPTVVKAITDVNISRKRILVP